MPLPLAPIRVAPYFLIVALLGALVAAYFLFPGFAEELNTLVRYIKAGDTDALSEWFAGFGWWGPVAIVVFFVVQMFLIVFPTWIPMVAAVTGYGALWGSLLSLAGVLAAGIIGFYVGQAGGKQSLGRWLGRERYGKLRNWVERYGFGGVALFRLSPFLSTDAVSFVAGAADMRLRHYLLATALGTLPLLGIIAYFGRDISDLKQGMWWAGGLGLAAFLVYAWMKYTSEEDDEESDESATENAPVADSPTGERVMS